ncbi:hypothetical protein P7K49_039421, partial [Saguinus oedipus]
HTHSDLSSQDTGQWARLAPPRALPWQPIPQTIYTPFHQDLKQTGLRPGPQAQDPGPLG